MNYVNDFLHRLSEYSWLLRDEDLQGLLRYVTAIVTILFSLVTFYVKRKEKREQARAQLAVAATSWDSRAGFPLYPLQTKFKVAPFPFVSPDIQTRKKSTKGWSTITEVRVWNAGQELLWGSAFNPTASVHLAIEEGLGDYALRGCLSNDISARVHLGRIVHAASGQKRLPIYFDVLRPGKGVLVQIWHNSQDVSKISINAISDQFSRTLVGLHHPMNPKIVKWMNTMAYWLVLPAAALTVVFMLSHNTAASVMSGVFTWMLIVSAYLNWRCEPRAPEDLGFRNDKAKIFFYHGPG